MILVEAIHRSLSDCRQYYPPWNKLLLEGNQVVPHNVDKHWKMSRSNSGLEYSGIPVNQLSFIPKTKLISRNRVENFTLEELCIKMHENLGTLASTPAPIPLLGPTHTTSSSNILLPHLTPKEKLDMERGKCAGQKRTFFLWH